MRVKDIMTSSVHSIEASDTIGYAAELMADGDVGALPVLTLGELVGIVTDRDIAVRAVAAGVSPDAPVTRIMTENVAACSPEDDVETALALMCHEKVRRMPVCNERGRLVGIVGLADITAKDPHKSEVTEALEDICKPSGLHCQPPVFA